MRDDGARTELDEQQLALLAALTRNWGGQASFAELRETGIEFPASIAEELELMGLPLERCALRRGGVSCSGVRLYGATPVDAADAALRAALASAPQASVRPAQHSPVLRLPLLRGSLPLPRLRTQPQLRRLVSGLRLPRMADLARRREAMSRVWRTRTATHLRLNPLIAALPVLAAVLVLLALIGGAASSGPASHDHALASRAPAAAHSAKARRRHGRAAARARHRRRSAPARRASGTVVQLTAAARASELQARGHELLEAGQGRSAALRLFEAVRATGKRVTDCIEPASQACLTYAYALYDLGRALAAEGHAGEAASVLQRRLRIDDQREAVASTLQRLRARSAPRPAANRHARSKRSRRAQPSPPIPGGVQAPQADAPMQG